MKLATRILRLAMPTSKAESLAGDLAEDLARRWRTRAAREGHLVVLAIGYAAIAFARRAARPPVDWLDVKLGLRMLAKYPGLTIIAVVSMSVAIAFGAGIFAVYSIVLPTIPLPDGERVVSIENFDTAARYDDPRVLHDFVAWREELTTFTDIGAFHDIERNLITDDGAIEAVTLAEMSASGFSLARVRPLLGRTLEARDEKPDADPVLVIGESVWRGRFGADPAIVGRTVRLGKTVHTIVGVMPERFAFPINHRLWVPFRLDPRHYERRRGPSLSVFARLAPHAGRGAAEAELAAAGLRAAEQFPKTHANLRPRLVPYAAVFADKDDMDDMIFLQAGVVILLVVIAVNVAILVYARTATRAGEIAVRAALGASRRRIIVQLFVEACVLAGVAAFGALLLLKVGLVQLESAFTALIPGGAPFWIDFSISPAIVANAAGLAFGAALIAGMYPAIKATGRRVHGGLQSLSGRGSGLRLGKAWTALVIAQVAVTVALLPASAVMAFSSLKYSDANPGFDATGFMTVRLGLDSDRAVTSDVAGYGAEHDARFRALETELIRHLDEERGLSDITLLWSVPGREPTMKVVFDGETASGEEDSLTVRFSRVDARYFEAFRTPMRAGRAFTAADLSTRSTAVIVNQEFVDRYGGGRQMLGRRIRYLSHGRPGSEPIGQDGFALPGSYEIVGIAGNLPARERVTEGMPGARVYHPLLPAHAYTTLAMRVTDEAAPALAGRLRDLAAALDPALRVNRVQPMLDIFRGDKTEELWGAASLAGITLATLLLAAGGIYALMSVTVSQRQREIGIRAALGAEPRRILSAIFTRVLAQVGAGALIGAMIASLLIPAAGLVTGPLSRFEIVALLASVVGLIIAIGLAAAYGPARRGLRIQPTEALRADG
jgi:predicted permease